MYSTFLAESEVSALDSNEQECEPLHSVKLTNIAERAEMTDEQIDILRGRLVDRYAKSVANVYQGPIDEILTLCAQAKEANALRVIRLTSYVNQANISAADVPHVVLEKLQAAIDAARQK